MKSKTSEAIHTACKTFLFPPKFQIEARTFSLNETTMPWSSRKQSLAEQSQKLMAENQLNVAILNVQLQYNVLRDISEIIAKNLELEKISDA